MITQQELKELLDYNPETGLFTWNLSAGKRVKEGNIAGSLQLEGYWAIGVKGKLYGAHRLAWLYVNGELPKGQIDHINGVRNDNRIENLREVTRRQNAQNQKIHRDGHLVGTSFRKERNKWEAYININKKRTRLGYHETDQEAHEAYLNKLKEIENES